MKDAGVEPFADIDGLLAMIYQTRSFHPMLEKKILPKDAKDAKIVTDPGTNVTSVNWDPIRLSFSLPPAYVEAAKNKKLNAVAPYPVIVTLHELEDFQSAKENKEFPGAEVIKRRWDRKSNKAVADSTIIVAPVATKAAFLEEGQPRFARVFIPLRELWQRYHVDFNRIVIDGGSDALLYAASQPAWYAGVIVRGDKADLPSPDLVRNLSDMPVYIVGTAESAAAKTLAAGGHAKDKVTVGGPEGLADFVSKVRRVTPRSFKWNVQDREAQQLARWINLEQFDPAVKSPTLEVAYVDTKDDPNTIRVTSEGIEVASFFLSDLVVDLDRPVRIVANGKLVTEARMLGKGSMAQSVKLPAKFDRTVDGLFAHPQINVLKGMYYGWLFPVALQQVVIPAADKEAACPKETATTAPDDPAAKERAEKDAQNYFDKATEKEKNGEMGKALDLYRKAVAAGNTAVKAKAEEKVKELEAKAASPTKPAGADKPNGSAK